MNILITGGKGFIGTFLCRALEDTGHEVTSMGREHGDMADPATMAAFDSQQFDYLFHLAARTFIPDSWDTPAPFYATNVQGTVNALDFCRRAEIPMTFVSSYVYGEPDTLPVTEDAPLKPVNPYTHTKILAEDACRFFASEYGVGCTVIRPFNVFGPGQNTRFLIPKIILQALNEPLISLFSPEPKRDYLHVRDLVRVLTMTMRDKPGMDIFNAGSGLSLSVREVVVRILEALEITKEVSYKGNVRKNEVMDIVASVDRLEREFGWAPQADFADSIREIATTFTQTGA